MKTTTAHYSAANAGSNFVPRLASGLKSAARSTSHTKTSENDVLREFVTVSPSLGVQCEYLCAGETAKRFPSVNRAI